MISPQDFLLYINIPNIAKTHNAQRLSDVNTLRIVVELYAVDNGGAFPASITKTSTIIGSGDGQIDLCDDLVPTYIAAMPFDPTGAGAFYTDCDEYNTGYEIYENPTTSQITIFAPSAELGQTISLTW